MKKVTARLFNPAASLAGVLLTFAIFPAGADDGKPRFVAGSGRDQGDCQNRFRPCRTLSYAAARAGKADFIRVAEGRYSIGDARQLLDLLALNGRIAAGYSKYSTYSERNATEATVLTGVPPEFRERFEAAGFTVIADTKGIDAAESQLMRKLTAQVMASEQSHALAPCVANQSAGFACQSVGLLKHMSFQDLQPSSSRGNDVWGYTDLNTQREYALMGLQNGVAVVDITNPEVPEQVGSATGSTTVWRDITVYQRYDSTAKRWRAYAYVTADSVSDFPMVLDLSQLPNGIERVNVNSDYRSAHTNYLVNADYTYGIATANDAPQLGVAGAGVNTGNYRLYALDDPRAPRLVNVSNRGYAHDLGSYALTDTRKDTQCVNAQSRPHCQVLTDFNENTIDVWDITSPAAPQQLASHPYANSGYVHSGFWTEDGRYLFAHDELDEQNFGLNTTVRVFDMRNLRAPVLAGSWVGPTRAIDHNGAVRGNRYYVANYSEGLTVLDISNPAAPQRVGYFDTYPASAQTGFVGAWSVYPFFASGTVAIGDINSGLYLLRNEALASPNGTFAVVDAALAGAEGQTVTIEVSRTGGATGAVSVQLDLLHGSTSAADVSTSTSTLNWADGDAQNKSATLTLADDAQAEDLELMLVRLKNPQGGATISSPDTAHVAIADAARTTRLRLLEAAPAVDEARGKALIAVSRLASATGEARVSYRTVPNANYTGFTARQGELIWADGDASGKVVAIDIDSTRLSAGQSATFQVEFFSPTNAELESSNGTTVTSLLATVTVSDTTSVTPNPGNPAQPGGSGGGGGAWHLLWLAALGLLPMLRRVRRTADLRHSNA